MEIPELTGLSDVALLLLRLLIAAVFATSGWAHATRPKERGERIEMTPPATLLLGVIEMLGAASVALGLYPEAGATLLIGVMFGAIYKKAFVWKMGFWGEEGGGGWYYELLYMVCCLVIMGTAGGGLTLT